MWDPRKKQVTYVGGVPALLRKYPWKRIRKECGLKKLDRFFQTAIEDEYSRRLEYQIPEHFKPQVDKFIEHVDVCDMPGIQARYREEGYWIYLTVEKYRVESFER